MLIFHITLEIFYKDTKIEGEEGTFNCTICEDVRRLGSQEVRRSGSQEVRKSGGQEVRRTGSHEVRRLGS
jgi:hypothetical protein